ncbi:vicilin Cor a 11.0101-like [Silene latifolia]|uniref:vicilin Cor a 11.0101-like n=1 Tax=Silene latifolia TaxID=37657 RepID=UPI003D78A918
MGLLTNRLCLVLLLIMVVYVGVTTTEAKEDPELRQCKHQCRHQRQFDESQKLGCERSCEEYIEEKERIRKWREQRDELGRDETDNNPYVFQEEQFRTHFSTQQGSLRVLPKFTQRSQLFKGIQNFRVLLFQANPHTFILPNHWDADAIFFVAQGRGTVSLVFTDRRESFSIEQGHVMVIPAGVTAYLINEDNDEKLVLAKLVNPVSNPGKFVTFFGPGGRNPESFFNAFSPEVLEAAFKTSSARLERIFSQQREGVIIRASEEQIRALTHKEGSHSVFGSKSSKDFSPVHLLRQRPTASNEFGKLFEIDISDNKVLQDLGIGVSFANISQGSMNTPFYNSRATKVAIVLNGKGQFEMACPHVSKSDHHHHQHRNPHHDSGRSQQGEERETPIHYEKISSELRPGTVFVVPPGHPFVTIASQNNNLEVICFEINAENNQKFPLAGQKNILRNIESEAKELAFATSADEVDSVFENQDEFFFFRGPRQWRQRGVAVV